MSNPTELLPRTAIAVTSWTDANKNIHIRVYTQDLNGGIRESRWDGKWTGGTAQDVIGQAKPTTSLAALSWDNGNQIRVYYLTPENIVGERVWSAGGSGWVGGALNAFKAQASPVSRIAVIGRNVGAIINIYFQKPDNVIQEVRYSDHWFTGSTLSKALVGTGLAAFVWNNAAGAVEGIRVYFQLPNSVLAEDGINVGSGWIREGFTSITAPAGTDLAVISWSATPQIRLYLISQSGELREYAYSGSWNGGITLPASTVPASNVAATTWGSITDIRVYRQANDNQILEEVWHSGWSVGSIIPTGNVQN